MQRFVKRTKARHTWSWTLTGARIRFFSGPELNFRFMYDDNSNTLWCDVAKCGSTTYVFTVFKELYTRAGFKIEVSPKMRGSQTAIR